MIDAHCYGTGTAIPRLTSDAEPRTRFRIPFPSFNSSLVSTVLYRVELIVHFALAAWLSQLIALGNIIY